MSYNKYYESWFRGNNTISQGSGYSDNVSLRNDGKTELRGDTYINNNGRLMINKDKNTSTTYLKNKFQIFNNCLFFFIG